MAALADKNLVFNIDGAAVFQNIEKVTSDTGEIAYRLPEMDKSYRYGMLYDGMKWASKDGKDFVLAINFECGNNGFGSTGR